jgi:Tol biopolymer transport system component
MPDAADRAKNAMREADISPDGFWLVVMNYPGGTNRDIYILAMNGSSLIRLTEDAGIDFDPAWNPAG